jgi:hypothetical protein
VFYECQSWNSLRLGTIGFDAWSMRLASACGRLSGLDASFLYIESPTPSLFSTV